ncbi:hypothetical protein E2C01_032730 [Portunus trituberculatus]|uniref:Uncharacterized protein n=1 Tax=Portunus trituberculatus TaxID=210409 RepID=A0A5B7F267_PORTR|nr:hypothetical protein [Portunus trituberculatus]
MLVTSTRSSSVRQCTISFSGQTIKLSAPGAIRGQWMEVFRHCQTHEAQFDRVDVALDCCEETVIPPAVTTLVVWEQSGGPEWYKALG